MSLSSSFTDFSLAELFQLIDHGRKSGCLTVCTLPDLQSPMSKSQYFYIWFRQGRVVAAAHHLHGQELISKIVKRGLANWKVIEKVCTDAPTAIPLGLLLKTESLLTAEQLNLLFANQLQKVRELFEIQQGVFKLDSKAALPLEEMTGLSLRATEVALIALRALKNWKALEDVLPNPSSAVKSISHAKPQIRLHACEWQVWEFANGSVSLNAIAAQINQPLALVQQATFRLMLAGLVEEVLTVTSTSNLNDDSLNWDFIENSEMKRQKSKESEALKISTSFLQNLVGFLKSKT
ncbi:MULTISPECIES: DUF4388 domain-containing protein [Nostocales]|uniref:DUF4388 domain-containing protein n=3 Tax=Nostocales TaxID=1161 RepID=A0A0C1N539_9CYAN|nr:DUF4388 domain-containing protein [Tolypothrix bouteillei]KAF3888947.1 DUF4388 domain-containing protein [Tolypothrix bouteillei VB521301]